MTSRRSAASSRLSKPAPGAKTTSAAEPSTIQDRPVSSEIERPRKPKLRGKAKVLASKEAYQGKVFSVWTDTVLEPGMDKPFQRDVIRHNGSIVILAADTAHSVDDPEIILIRQYRHAAGQFLLELPAGRIDAGEKPLAAGKRELIEETGFRAKRWSSLARYYASPGFLGEWMEILVAEDLRQGAATPEDDEHIEIVRTPLSEAIRMVRDNKIHDGKTIIGLSIFSMRRNAVAAG